MRWFAEGSPVSGEQVPCWMARPLAKPPAILIQYLRRSQCKAMLFLLTLDSCRAFWRLLRAEATTASHNFG